MLKEDGPTFLSTLEVKTSIKLGGQEISTTPTTTGDNVSINSTGLTNITATDVQGLVEEIDPLLGNGGATVEGIVSWRNAVNETLTATPQQISNLIFTIGNAESAIPPGNYRVKTIIKCQMASGYNENLTVAFFKRNTITPTGWAVINEQVTFNEAYLTVETSNYGIENRPNYLVLEEVLTLVEGDQVGVFINSETSGGATVQNSQLFYEKTAMTINRYAANFDV